MRNRRSFRPMMRIAVLFLGILFASAMLFEVAAAANRISAPDLNEGGFLIERAFPFLPSASRSPAEVLLSSALPSLRISSSKPPVSAHSAPSPKDAPTSLPVPDVKTKEITSLTASQTGYISTSNIYINNNTSKSVDIDTLLAKDSPITCDGVNPTVLIVHTHTSEAYTPTEKMNYTPTDNDRTEDENFNVVRVGEELKSVLESHGIVTVHNTSINDYPSYNGSYQKTYGVICEELAAHPTISVVIDLHRDALIYDDGSKMKVTWDSPEGKAAQAMLVVGTNERLEHPRWQENLSFALKLQKEMATRYPDLARPINLARHRYNAQVSPCAVILEMGANGNTLEEALLGVKYAGECLSGVILAESKNNS